MPDFIWIAVAGFIGGFIDSIAGGGGLITLPTLMIAIGPGASAIATNKIAGTTAALLAARVYAKHARLDSNALRFVGSTALGAVLGTRVSALLQPAFFPMLLLLTAPIVIWLAFQKDRWLRIEARRSTRSIHWLILCGVATGFYDGAWGPGGGTLMLLASTWIAGAPLAQALLWSKLANTASAAFALIGFVTLSPEVQIYWPQGFALAGGCALGASLGARTTVRHASKIVRPALVIIALLLILRATVPTLSAAISKKWHPVRAEQLDSG